MLEQEIAQPRIIRFIRTPEDLAEIIRHGEEVNYDAFAIALNNGDLSDLEFNLETATGVPYAVETCKTKCVTGKSTQQYFYCRRVA